MRYHTKEYYELLMALDSAGMYEPVVDKEIYTEEDIEELYQKAMDKYLEEERADYDAPPELFIDEEEGLDPEDAKEYAIAVEEYEAREPFDEELAKEEFEELYRDNLEEPDEDLPGWVRESVDHRLLAMYLMPEKTYEKLAAQDEENQEKFDALDEAADNALEDIMDELPEEYVGFIGTIVFYEDEYVLEAKLADGDLTFNITGFTEDGDITVRELRFNGVEIIEDEGINIEAWEDEDGDPESDCELLYSELYKEDGKPEVHMLFNNNGLKYFTFRCSGASAYDEESGETVHRGRQ